VSKEVNFVEISEADKRIILYVLDYKIKEGIVCDKNQNPIVDKYGNTVTLKNVAIVPNPDGDGHILIEYDILTASEYLSELSK